MTAGRMPPALDTVRGQLTPAEWKLCLRIATDLYPYRFVIRLPELPRFLLCAMLLNDWPLDRMQAHAERQGHPDLIAEIKAGLAEVERTHA